MSADDGASRVADQELAVVAKRQPQAPRRTEHPHLAAGGLQRRKEVRRQALGAEGVVQHPHAHAARARREQRPQQR